MAKKKTRGLGKGLDALFGEFSSDVEEQIEKKERKPYVSQKKKAAKDTVKSANSIADGTIDNDSIKQSIGEIDIAKIEVNPFQPRSEFTEEALHELSSSIKVHGIIQPITVRSMGDGNFQLISGERRLRASKLAGLTSIPAYVRPANDQEMLEIALIENIQRENLNAIEVSISYRRLLEECNLTHDTLGERLGKDRSTITNYLRLLKLPPEMQRALKENKLSMGHARALLSLEDDLINQLSAFQSVMKNQLSVRKTEQLIKNIKTPKSETTAPSSQQNKLPLAHQKVQDELSEQFETKVSLKYNTETQKGVVQIPFVSDDDLNRILDLLR